MTKTPKQHGSVATSLLIINSSDVEQIVLY